MKIKTDKPKRREKKLKKKNKKTKNCMGKNKNLKAWGIWSPFMVTNYS